MAADDGHASLAEPAQLLNSKRIGARQPEHIGLAILNDAVPIGDSLSVERAGQHAGRIRRVGTDANDIELGEAHHVLKQRFLPGNRPENDPRPSHADSVTAFAMRLLPRYDQDVDRRSPANLFRPEESPNTTGHGGG